MKRHLKTLIRYLVRIGSDVSPVLSLERANLTGVYLANTGVAEFIEVSIVKLRMSSQYLRVTRILKSLII